MSSVSVLMEKKSKSPKKNFQSVKEGRERKKKVQNFGCSGKKIKMKEKFREKKSKFFGWKCKVKDFAKFVFTVWGFY